MIIWSAICAVLYCANLFRQKAAVPDPPELNSALEKEEVGLDLIIEEQKNKVQVIIPIRFSHTEHAG